MICPKKDAQCHDGQKVNQEFDVQLFPLRSGEKTDETYDHDAHLDCADERGQGIGSKEGNAELLNAGKRWGVTVTIQAFDIGSEGHLRLWD